MGRRKCLELAQGGRILYLVGSFCPSDVGGTVPNPQCKTLPATPSSHRPRADLSPRSASLRAARPRSPPPASSRCASSRCALLELGHVGVQLGLPHSALHLCASVKELKKAHSAVDRCSKGRLVRTRAQLKRWTREPRGPRKVQSCQDSDGWMTSFLKASL